MYIFFLSIFYEIVSKPIDRQEEGEKDLLIVIRYTIIWYIYISFYLMYWWVREKKEWECAYITKTKVAFSMLIMNYHTQFFSFDYRAFF